MRVPSSSLATCRFGGKNKHEHVRIRHGNNSPSCPLDPTTDTHFSNSPIPLPFPSLFLLLFPSISLSLSSSVPHFKYTPSVLIHYPSFSFKILSHLQLPTITIAQEMALNSFRAFLSIFSLLFTIVAAEDPYRFFTWNVTFGDIYPLGVRQQVCYLNLLLFSRKNQLD